MADPEILLRELRDKQGITKEEQDEIMRGIEDQGKPGAQIGPWTIGEVKP